MAENILAGFTLFFVFWNFVALAAGVAIGVVVGAIPGLTATMAVALALPFTFGMDPVTSLLLLVGIYKGGIYAGSITAILIKAPGTPAAACTVLDGYPLARKGQARKALDMGLYSSCIADFCSNLSLILLAGVIVSFATRFGPVEYFWLIAFSLTVIVAVSGNSLIRGLISAFAGILLSTVGLDLVYGTERFMFGSYTLSGGLPFVPMLIGLFAIPEILAFYARRSGQASETPTMGSPLTWREFRPSLPSIFRGSLIGVLVGALPGTGATPAAFISYAEARRTSKNRANFGKGELEGVAASESANNGTAGATLIPLVALGIPGDVVTAIMLGAFMIHGLTPGPLLFREHIDLVYALFWGIMLSSFALFVAGKIMVACSSRVAEVPTRLLAPAILMFCAFGAYAVNNSMLEVLVMLIAGGFGYLMLRAAIPPAPLLIGFVLGPLFEDNLRRAVIVGRGDPAVFFSSAVAWLFIVLTVASLSYSLWQAWRDSGGPLRTDQTP